MLIIVVVEFFSLGMLGIIAKYRDRYNINDIILGISFISFLFFVFCGGIIYYNYQYYPYYEEIREEVAYIEFNSVVLEFSETYGYYYDDDLKEIEKKYVELHIEKDVEPHIRVCRVIRNYNVEDHKLFNIMIAFRFKNYTKVLDEYVYEIYSPKLKVT